MKNLFVFLFACCVQAVPPKMPHGALAQVAQTSYKKGEFLCLLFIIMSINLQKGTAKLGIKDIYFIIREHIRKWKKQQGINLLA